MAVSMDPIATYTERLLEVRRDFSLYKDRVEVRARWLFKGQFQTVVKLENLKGQIREITVRYRMNRYAGWILAIGALVFAIIYYNLRGAPLGIFAYISLGVTIIGLLLTAITYPNRRIKFARFESRSGRSGLDIGAAGNSTEEFREFVAQVKRQIGKA